MECVLCKKEIEDKQGWNQGNNAEPVAEGRCCDACDAAVVIPARVEMAREGQIARVAFERAIVAGRLSANPQAPNYAGKYMFMGPGKGGDAFKNIVTREYIAY